MGSFEYYIAFALLGIFVFGIPLIIASSRLPKHLGLQPVNTSDVPLNIFRFFSSYDERMRALGFEPHTFFRAHELDNANLCRSYNSIRDSGLAFVYVLKNPRSPGDAPEVYVEFINVFSNGGVLRMSNNEVSTPFPDMPHIYQEQHPGYSVEKLYAAQSAKLAQTKMPLASRIPPSELLSYYESEHEKFLSYQVARGYLKLNPTTGYFHATPKLALLGILNFLNPFADDFTVSRFAIATAAGLVPFVVPFQFALLSYPITGAGIAFAFRRKVLLWTVIVAYLPMLLTQRSHPTAILLCLFSAIYAAQMIQKIKKKKVDIPEDSSKIQKAA